MRTRLAATFLQLLTSTSTSAARDGQLGRVQSSTSSSNLIPARAFHWDPGGFPVGGFQLYSMDPTSASTSGSAHLCKQEDPR